MSDKNYLTTPPQIDHMPSGIPYIVGNEAAERFSFYGMKCILVVFMTQFLMAGDGSSDFMNQDEAKGYYHLFTMAVYFFPVLGALIADAFWGKYKTIMILSVVYCLGHLTLAINLTRPWFFLGLMLIAVGSGGIKPCVSAHVGDQFGSKNKGLLPKVFSWFYLSINLGAFVSTLLTPYLLNHPKLAPHGPHWAFGVPGALMCLATLVFWMGRNTFVHVPASGWQSVKDTFTDSDGLQALRNLIPIYLLVAVFWSLFDQTGSAWVLQAQRMDRNFLGIEWHASQIQAVNPCMILLFIPLFAYVLYPSLNKLFNLTPLRKMAIGMFITVLAFLPVAIAETMITGGYVVSTTSVGDQKNHATSNLLDGSLEGAGWVSAKIDKKKEAKKEPEKQGQSIVLRLRELRAWEISEVRVNPAVDLDEFLKNQQEEAEKAGKEFTEEESHSSWAKTIEVGVSDSRKGEWEILGTLNVNQADEWSTLTFEPVETEYVRLRVLDNYGGSYVALDEIEVIAADASVPADAHDQAAEIWPNVAAIGFRPTIMWQILAYMLLTAAEVMISITGLEFTYTQAPKAMKSFMMSLWLLSVAVGNAFTSAVNFSIIKEDGSSKLEGAAYYNFFLITMLSAAVLFILVAKTYKGKTYIQGEDEITEADVKPAPEQK